MNGWMDAFNYGWMISTRMGTANALALLLHACRSANYEGPTVNALTFDAGALRARTLCNEHMLLCIC